MNKKSVAASVLVVFMAIVFSVVGICFSYFVYKDTKIVVSKVMLSATEGIEVYSDKELKVSANELKLSNMDVGLKPATGELDQETQIPSTINDEGTSEGYYSKIFVKASKNYKIVVKDVEIVSDKDEIEIKEQRKNIFVAIKDVKNSTKSIEKEVTEIASFQDVSETQELVFYIWLSSLTDDVLEGAKINFTLDFQVI